MTAPATAGAATTKPVHAASAPSQKKEASDLPVSEENFSATAYAGLRRAGYTTLGLLAQATNEQLRAIPGIGDRKIQHIDMVLALAGLRRAEGGEVARRRGRQPAKVATKICANLECQKEFSGPWYTIKNRQFCSRTCANNGMTRADGRDDEIRALFAQNIGVREIAKQYNISHQRVSQIVGRADAKRPERVCIGCGTIFTPNATMRVRCDGCAAKRSVSQRLAEAPLDPALFPHLTEKGKRAALGRGGNRGAAAAVAATSS